MKLLKAIETVLSEAGEPLHYREVTRRILDQRLWQTEGKTPDATVSSYFTGDTKYNGHNSLFQRTGEGIYALRSWGLPEFHAIAKDDESESESDNGTPASAALPVVNASLSGTKTLSFTDAAEEVLKRFSGNKPMHYRDITQKAMALGLIKTSGLTPEATLSSQILTEIERQTKRGDTPRFIKHGKGFFGLTKWMPIELISRLASQIEQQNNSARKKLHERLFTMSPKDFEVLVGQLLGALGFVDILVTKYSGDGGIDVRGTLVVGDVIRINMAVQVKRWKNNLQAPEVQKVRGSLGTHDQGLIITTGDFSSGAHDESSRANAVPVALMNGEQLVSLLVEHNIGVHRTSYELIELGETDE
jgi:restriction system protein